MSMSRCNPRVIPQFSVCLLVLLALSCLAGAYPVPAGTPFRWEFEFKTGDFRLYVDKETSQAYWWMHYTVTNRTKRDRIWAPKFTLFTDVGEILESGKDVPSTITVKIKDLLGNELIETQNEIIGDLLQGTENARDGLVIWPARVLQVNEITMFISGISGETIRVRNPITGEQVILYKSLQRDYIIPGDALARGLRPIDLKAQQWILR